MLQRWLTIADGQVFFLETNVGSKFQLLQYRAEATICVVWKQGSQKLRGGMLVEIGKYSDHFLAVPQTTGEKEPYSAFFYRQVE